VNPALGTQVTVGVAAADTHSDALEPGLLTFQLIKDLGREAVALGPAQVHAQQHLGPVSCLGPTGAGGNGQDRVVLVVLTGEQERRSQAVKVGRQGLVLVIEPGLERSIVRLDSKLSKLAQVGGALQQ
jgi:hypothetical protein